MVLTLNRKAIVNNIDEMKSLISVIDEEARQAGVKVIAPLRGKALGFVLAFKAYLKKSNHQSGIQVVQPLDYLSFAYTYSSRQRCDYRFVMWLKKLPSMGFLALRSTAILSILKL